MEKWVSKLLECTTSSETGTGIESWQPGSCLSPSPPMNLLTTSPIGQPKEATCDSGSMTAPTSKISTAQQRAPGWEISPSGSGGKLKIVLTGASLAKNNENGLNTARTLTTQPSMDTHSKKQSERPLSNKRKQPSLPLNESRAGKRRKTQQPPRTAPPPKRGEGGRFLKRSTESTVTRTSPPKTQSEPVSDSPPTHDNSNSDLLTPLSSKTFSFPLVPMPSAGDIASDLVSAILLNASASHSSPLIKLNHDLIVKKRCYPLFLQYVLSFLDFQEPQPFSYITMNLITTDCLKHFGFD